MPKDSQPDNKKMRNEKGGLQNAYYRRKSKSNHNTKISPTAQIQTGKE